VFSVLCDLLTGECTTQPVLHATSGCVCVDFELGHQLQLAIVPFSCRKSVKCQHPWQKATSSGLLRSAVSCGILAQVLLALPQFIIVGSGRRPCARTQPSGETHLRQHHDGSGDGGEGGTSVGVSDVRTHSFLSPHSLHVAVGLYPCDS